MKLPITKEEILSKREKAKDKNKFDEKVKKFYREFNDQQELEKYFEEKGAVWNTYTAKDLGVEKMEDFSEEQSKSFEFYVCGWLQYYDEITRNDAIKHILYFKWNDKDVVVYISPAPGDSLNPITSPPAESTSDPKPPTAPPPPYP